MGKGRIGAGWLVFAAALWILGHPYEGLRHDAIFYAAAALRHLQPEAYATDIFFVPGSHADYSAFAAFYGRAMALLGVERAAFLLFVLGQAGWFGALVFLVRRLVPPPGFVHALAFLAGANLVYGEFGLLGLAEGFPTARLFGEAAALGALALHLYGRPVLALVPLAFGALAHPLMTAPAAGVIALCVLRRHRPGWVVPLAVALGLIAVLVVSRVAPGGWILRMDPEWYELVRRRTPMVSPHEWSAFFWIRAVVPCLLLFAAARRLPAPVGSLCSAVAWVGLAGLVLTVLGAGEQWALLIQSQPWRAVWLAFVIAPLALFHVAVRHWRDDRPLALLAMGGVGSIVLSGFDWAGFVGPALLLHAIVLLGRAGRQGVVGEQGMAGERGARLAAWSFVILLLGTGAVLSVLTAIAALRLPQSGPGWTVWLDYSGWLVLPLVTGLAAGAARLRPEARKLGLAAAMLLAAVAAGVVDRRADHLRFDERLADAGIDRWREAIPVGATVLWPDRLFRTWLVLRRASYVSRPQAAVAMFVRDAAFETVWRMERIAPLATGDGVFDYFAETRSGHADQATQLAALVDACADERLDFVVLATQIGAPFVPDYRDPHDGQRYHLYDCARYR